MSKLNFHKKCFKTSEFEGSFGSVRNVAHTLDIHFKCVIFCSNLRSTVISFVVNEKMLHYIT